MLEFRRRRSRITAQVILTLLVVPFAFPLVVMLQGSLAGSGWGNYRTVLSLGPLPQFFVNSMLIALGVIVLVLLCSLTAAFGFSKLGIRGKEIYFWALLACLTLPEVVLLTPLFATVTATGTFNTLLAVIIPQAALLIPFGVLLARNFVDGVPNELLEAARVDGAGTVRVFRHVMVPLSRPITAAIVVLVFIASWNDYLLPLLFLQTPDKQTITLVPQFFSGQYNNDQTKILAAAVLTALPVIVLYLCFQRFFERGLAAGALK
jgi:ABC-type glycerol-3-phosphate transport system permease component